MTITAAKTQARSVPKVGPLPAAPYASARAAAAVGLFPAWFACKTVPQRGPCKLHKRIFSNSKDLRRSGQSEELLLDSVQ